MEPPRYFVFIIILKAVIFYGIFCISLFSGLYCKSPAISGESPVYHASTCGQYLFLMLIEAYVCGKFEVVASSERLTSVQPEPDQLYDFIVVGAGTAGSIVAGRLSENEQHNVLLLEAGGPESLVGSIPGFYHSSWLGKDVDYVYRCEPGNYCLAQKGRICSWTRGRVVGGSSVINGMMYSRGHAADYDVWVKVTNSTSWSWEALQPFFDMSECNKQIGYLVSPKYHSAHGRVPVQQFNYQPPALYEILKWAEAAGFPIIKDMNNPHTPVGFTVAQAFNDNGQRVTTARTYLAPKWKRPNLTVTMHAHVTRVIFEGKRATGVEYLNKNGVLKTVHAAKEVILSGGALNTPQILMLSGVGPKWELDKWGILVRANLPVGQNLKSSVGVQIPIILSGINNTITPEWNIFTEYLSTRGGLLSGTGLNQLTACLYSRFGNRHLQQPDLQIFISGYYPHCNDTNFYAKYYSDHEHPEVGYIVFDPVALLPRSVGYMTLRSLNPLDPPLLYPNFLDNPDDILMLSDGLKYLESFFFSKNSVADKYKVKLDTTYTQVCDCIGDQWSEAWNECMIRQHTNPQNSQIGTTALGSVLDYELKVYNLENLRVCDAGSMPSLPTGSLQGPIMALAEKCAYLIQKSWHQIN